ncbi:hypothetical protein FO488_04985 [Geobacter sp. FeAm09]|uniref:hypothetical protein n=1 Tax=Geobacter sp. FeAm09 TaxID=2597769 RepID=UPI0011EE24D6|nr:hypothetical protein [Geobacter sp. FeAm09]QEM67567.1 hypothetical protein FO488_04985 [Geobacter sp. FeAm09]
MKRLLLLIAITLLTAGCVAVPVYDDAYYHPYYYSYYGPYPYAYWGPDFVFVTGGHGGHGYYGRDVFYGRGSVRGGDGGFRGGGMVRGGGSRGGVRR